MSVWMQSVCVCVYMSICLILTQYMIMQDFFPRFSVFLIKFKWESNRIQYYIYRKEELGCRSVGRSGSSFGPSTDSSAAVFCLAGGDLFDVASWLSNPFFYLSFKDAQNENWLKCKYHIYPVGTSTLYKRTRTHIPPVRDEYVIHSALGWGSVGPS